MSGGLDRVSRMKAIAAALLRFCTSTLMPGYFFSNALANGTVRSLENEVTMTSLSPMPWAEAALGGERECGGERQAAGDRGHVSPPGELWPQLMTAVCRAQAGLASHKANGRAVGPAIAKSKWSWLTCLCGAA